MYAISFARIYYYLLNEGIIATKQSLPEYIGDTIYTISGLDYRGFENKWSHSKQRPDLAIEVEDTYGDAEVKWVLEVGFAETYEQLVEEMKLWLEGTDSVSIAVLVKFIETPAYKYPIPLDQDPEELGIPLDRKRIRGRHIITGEGFGPAFYQEQQWVGHISEAFMEIWNIDTDTNTAKRQGDRIDLLDTARHSIEFELSTFATIDPQNDRTISLDLDKFRKLLKRDIKRLAADRCHDILSNYAKRMREGPDDRDYEP
jgi:hypothetical protein